MGINKSCLNCKYLNVIKDGIINIHVCDKQEKYMSYDIVLIGRCENYNNGENINENDK